MRQYTRLLRIALLILGSFLLAFVVLGLVFTFRIKKSTVTAEAKSLVENLGTKSEIDAASELAALQQTEVQTASSVPITQIHLQQRTFRLQKMIRKEQHGHAPFPTTLSCMDSRL